MAISADVIPRYLHFHDLPMLDQKSELERLDNYRRLEEQPHFTDIPTIPHLEAMDTLIHAQKLVPVISGPDFGIVAPIRNRYSIPMEESEGSMPFLRPGAYVVLKDFMSDVQKKANEGDFVDIIKDEGFVGFRPSLTSMTRTTEYQKSLARNGRLAVGTDGRGGHSVHEMGWAFDVDHTGLYLRRGTDDEISLNPSPDKSQQTHDVIERIRPAYRKLLASVVALYKADGTLVALDELPNGWGVYHVAVIPHNN